MSVHKCLPPLLLLLALAGCDNDRDEAPAAREPHQLVKVDNPHLENCYKVTPKVWSGAQPHDEAAFAALKELGVKTVLSVDGAKPDNGLAQKYGMRYVHLPIGYDQVPRDQAENIAKALQELPGPIYVHCHHGKHRSPAAVTVACVLNGDLTNDEAVAALKVFGTGENYLGLWESARSAKPIDRKALKKKNVKFVAEAPIPPMAEVMVEIDNYFEHLGDCKKAGWKAPADHPDLNPAHEALKLREQLFEMTRVDGYKKHTQKFQWLADTGVENAETLETALREGKDAETLNAAYTKIEQNCKTCHSIFRNVPQKK